MFYFGQVFVFWKLINKNVLEWFLPVICKEHTLTRSTSLFSRNHPILCFWLRREGRQMPNIKELLHITDKSSHQMCSIKKSVLKNFAIFTFKNQCYSNAGVFLLRNLKKKKFYFEECFWTHFRKWLCETLFLDSCFQNYPDSVTAQEYQSLSNYSFEHNSAHMPSLYLTSTLCFEPRFVSYVHH